MSWQKRFGGRPLSHLAIAVTLTLVAQAASAQLVGSRSVQATGCASAAVGGDVRDTTITTVCGMPSEQVVELVRLAASPQAGDRAELMARLEEAVAAYREALKERTRERVPLDWAENFGNEGVALILLAERRGDAAMAKTALSQINTAFETMGDGGHAPGAAFLEQYRARARALVERLSGRSGARP